MNNKFSWSGVIVVMLCLACMLYYYLIFRYAINTQIHHQRITIDNTSN